MLRNLVITLTVLAPTQVFAFDFGFVRGPDWMDPYVNMLLVGTVAALLLTLMFKPKGVPANQMYQHFGEFSLLGRLVYAIFGLFFVALMAMVFWGMGLQRAAEAAL